MQFPYIQSGSMLNAMGFRPSHGNLTNEEKNMHDFLVIASTLPRDSNPYSREIPQFLQEQYRENQLFLQGQFGDTTQQSGERYWDTTEEVRERYWDTTEEVRERYWDTTELTLPGQNQHGESQYDDIPEVLQVQNDTANTPHNPLSNAAWSRITKYKKVSKKESTCSICTNQHIPSKNMLALPCCEQVMCRVCATTHFTKRSKCPFCNAKECVKTH
jgi:hypothetical protein